MADVSGAIVLHGRFLCWPKWFEKTLYETLTGKNPGVEV
jgi:hypothetical protein